MLPSITPVFVTTLLLVNKGPGIYSAIRASRSGYFFLIFSNIFLLFINIVPLPVWDLLNCKMKDLFLYLIFLHFITWYFGKYFFKGPSHFICEIFSSTSLEIFAGGFNNFQLFSLQIFSIWGVFLKTRIP